jgi:hypothetical protein
MKADIHITLCNEMAVEILNNLYDGLEVWRDTAEHLASGSIVTPCVIAKCSSPTKARSMIRLYNGAISTIEKTLRSKE